MAVGQIVCPAPYIQWYCIHYFFNLLLTHHRHARNQCYHLCIVVSFSKKQKSHQNPFWSLWFSIKLTLHSIHHHVAVGDFRFRPSQYKTATQCILLPLSLFAYAFARNLHRFVDNTKKSVEWKDQYNNIICITPADWPVRHWATDKTSQPKWHAYINVIRLAKCMCTMWLIYSIFIY